MNVLFADEQDQPIVTDELLMLAELVLDAEGLDDDTGVAIVLIDEQQMTELNVSHMGKEGPTDVLSFPIETAHPGSPPARVPGGPPIELGDVFIAPSVVRRNAEHQAVLFRGRARSARPVAHRDQAIDDLMYAFRSIHGGPSCTAWFGGGPG